MGVFEILVGIVFLVIVSVGFYARKHYRTSSRIVQLLLVVLLVCSIVFFVALLLTGNATLNIH
ncbi:MAG: hypothetical protein UY04_C0036G0010 [Parcubacteria group bacterium GW2011_GWA2_47_7]|nr:MAG: hypothetical protein UY04_C0036G0010 [Parcubacteria group bacterium GW2011_GWA2_47_7]